MQNTNSGQPIKLSQTFCSQPKVQIHVPFLSALRQYHKTCYPLPQNSHLLFCIVEFLADSVLSGFWLFLFCSHPMQQDCVSSYPYCNKITSWCNTLYCHMFHLCFVIDCCFSCSVLLFLFCNVHTKRWKMQVHVPFYLQCIKITKAALCRISKLLSLNVLLSFNSLPSCPVSISVLISNKTNYK